MPSCPENPSCRLPFLQRVEFGHQFAPQRFGQMFARLFAIEVHVGDRVPVNHAAPDGVYEVGTLCLPSCHRLESEAAQLRDKIRQIADMWPFILPDTVNKFGCM